MLNLGPTVGPRQAARIAAFMAAFSFVPVFVARAVLVGFDGTLAIVALVSFGAALLARVSLPVLSTALLLATGWLGVLGTLASSSAHQACHSENPILHQWAGLAP